MKRERERVARAPTVASTVSRVAGLDADPKLQGSARDRQAREGIRARQPLRSRQFTAIGQLSPTAPADSALIQRAESSYLSSESAWTAAHRWPLESEHHRCDPTSIAITAPVYGSTDKGAA